MPFWKYRSGAGIIFDARGRARLPAERAAVERQHRQSFGSGINRGRKTGGAGPNDGHVKDAVRVDRSDQSNAARQFDFARIAQHVAGGAQHDRQLPRVDMKAIDQRPRFGIGLRIEPFVRIAVAIEEALEPQHVRIVGAADNDRATDAGLKHFGAAQDQGSHDPLAEFGLGDQQCAHLLRIKEQRLARPARHRVRERRPTGELRSLTENAAGPEAGNELALAQSVVPANIDRAVEDQRQAGPDFADRGQRLARRQTVHHAESAGALDIVGVQRRIDLIVPALSSMVVRGVDMAELCAQLPKQFTALRYPRPM